MAEPNTDIIVTGVSIAPSNYTPTDEEITILKRTIAKDLTDAELKFVARWCEQVQLSPFLKHIKVWKQGDTLNFQTTIDGMRAIGMRSGKFRGRLGPFWCGKDGVWKEVWLEDGPPAAARVGIKWAGLDDVQWGVAKFSSYANRPGTGPLWRTMPDVMIAKVAESVVWRLVCPADLAGVYGEGELPEEDDKPPAIEQKPVVIVEEHPPESLADNPLLTDKNRAWQGLLEASALIGLSDAQVKIIAVNSKLTTADDYKKVINILRTNPDRAVNVWRMAYGFSTDIIQRYCEREAIDSNALYQGLQDDMQRADILAAIRDVANEIAA